MQSKSVLEKSFGIISNIDMLGKLAVTHFIACLIGSGLTSFIDEWISIEFW